MTESSNRENSDTLSLYAALALFFSIIELLIPKPIPFFRIGLANLPLLVALTFLSPKDFFILILLKIGGQAIVGGTLFSYVFLFSASGSFASGMVMLLLRSWYPRRISLVGIGVLGALGSNAAQLVCATWLIFGRSTRLVAPLLLMMGTVSGILLGAAAQYVLKHSRWVGSSAVWAAGAAKNGDKEPGDEERRESPAAWSFCENPFALGRLFFGLMMVPPLILQEPPLVKLVHILLILLYSGKLGLKVRLLPGFFIVLAVTAAAILTPMGELLFSLASFPVTAGALDQGLTRGLNLVGMVYLSRCAISTGLKLPGRAGRLLYRVLYYFEELTALRLKKSNRRGLINNLKEKLSEVDGILLNWSAGTNGSSASSGNGIAAEGSAFSRGTILVALVVLCLQWLIYAGV